MSYIVTFSAKITPTASSNMGTLYLVRCGWKMGWGGVWEWYEYQQNSCRVVLAACLTNAGNGEK